jgi:uncharacterized LabA/DUF88 family protein
LTRVAVFIDYQNVYMGARAAFCPETSSHVDGQVDPLKVGRSLTRFGSEDRHLVAVRVYRGLPSSANDPKGYGAASRQVSMWAKLGLVKACTRPLNYRDRSAPREKGVDVLLAVDFVLMAARDLFDVGVIFSADTDLVPALEAVIEMKGEQACEVAYWQIPGLGLRRAIGVKGRSLVRHGLDESAYRWVHDPTDYTVRRRRR